MSEPFVGEIRMAGFNFAPVNWATCDGQLMPISQNTALFSLLGTMYGGDGKSTFALPDLESADCVQVMTIHKAKGLEFDTVIVPGLAGETAKDDAFALALALAKQSGTAVYVVF